MWKDYSKLGSFWRLDVFEKKSPSLSLPILREKTQREEIRTQASDSYYTAIWWIITPNISANLLSRITNYKAQMPDSNRLLILWLRFNSKDSRDADGTST